MRKRWSRFALALAVAVHATGASAATRFVSTSGVDAGGCEDDHRCRTIQFAVDAASPGDTIAVSPGTYYENVLITKPDLTLRGSGASSTIIHGDATTNVVYAYFVSSFTIEGFTVTNAANSGSLPGSAAIHLDAGPLRVGNWVVRNNILEGNGFGLALWNSLGGGSALIENNLIANNTYVGIANDGHPFAIIRHNTIVGNGWHGYEDFIGIADIAIVNNIIVGNGFAFGSSCPICGSRATGIQVGPAGTYYIAYNDVFGNSGGDYGQHTGQGDYVPYTPSPATGEISVDPAFEDPATGNYRLTPDSSAVDAGTNQDAPAEDLDGGARRADGDGNGTAVADMGAFELPGGPDTIAPVIILAAQPTKLGSPNGKRVIVTVSGMVVDEVSGLNPNNAAYVVMDEYGKAAPSPSSLTLGADGHFTFTVALEAARRGQDRDGRQYAIAVSAQDSAGNTGVATTAVTVLHDQAK